MADGGEGFQPIRGRLGMGEEGKCEQVASEALFFGVDNLLDAGDALYLPLVPRGFYGGFTVRTRSAP